MVLNDVTLSNPRAKHPETQRNLSNLSASGIVFTAAAADVMKGPPAGMSFYIWGYSLVTLGGAATITAFSVTNGTDALFVASAHLYGPRTLMFPMPIKVGDNLDVDVADLSSKIQGEAKCLTLYYTIAPV